MNIKRNYYLIVPNDNIYTKKTHKHVVVIDNDTTNQIFDSYNIPKQFQKMVLKISTDEMLNSINIVELITDKSFCFEMNILDILFKPLANPVIEIFSNDANIVTDNKLYHADDIKAFYQSIIDNDLALNYEKAIKEILNVEKESTLKDLFIKTKKRNTK